MSRKFNTKIFIKDVLNDRYALVIGNEIILDAKIVTEPGGLIEMEVYNKTDEKQIIEAMNSEGLPSNLVTFSLPEDRRSTIELEIHNLTEKDLSFVVLSN